MTSETRTKAALDAISLPVVISVFRPGSRQRRPSPGRNAVSVRLDRRRLPPGGEFRDLIEHVFCGLVGERRVGMRRISGLLLRIDAARKQALRYRQEIEHRNLEFSGQAQEVRTP